MPEKHVPQSGFPSQDWIYWISRITLLFFSSPWLSDIPRYFYYSKLLIIDGKIPYRDFSFEYTPLVYVLFLSPAAIHKLLSLNTIAAYRLLFSLSLLPFDYLLFRKFRNFENFSAAGLIYLVLSLGSFPFLFDRFDILMAFFLAWPFLSGKIKKMNHLPLYWGVGAAIKLVSLPPLLIYLLAQGRPVKKNLSAWMIAMLPLFLSLAIGIALSLGGSPFLSHHANRGVQVESLIANLAILIKISGFAFSSAAFQYDFGSDQLVGIPGLSIFAKIFFWVSISLTLFALWRVRERISPSSIGWIFISSFLSFGYVLSPQFILWIIPLGLIVSSELDLKKRSLWLFALTLATALTTLHFLQYQSFLAMNPFSVGLLTVRNLSLFFLWSVGWLWLLKPNASRM